MAIDITQTFREKLKLVKEKTNDSIPKISSRTGISRSRLENAYYGRSFSATNEDLNLLLNAYPEKLPDSSNSEVDNEDEIIHLLKANLEETREGNRLLREIRDDLLKEETRADAIAKLTDMLHKKEMGEE